MCVCYPCRCVSMPVELRVLSIKCFSQGGNARFWGLRAMIDVLGNDIKSVVAVNISSTMPPPIGWPTSSIVYGVAFVRSDGQRVTLLANTNSSDQNVELEGAAGGRIYVVDLDHGHGDVAYSNMSLSSQRIRLAALAVVLVEMPRETTKE